LKENDYDYQLNEQPMEIMGFLSLEVFENWMGKYLPGAVSICHA